MRSKAGTAAFERQRKPQVRRCKPNRVKESQSCWISNLSARTRTPLRKTSKEVSGCQAAAGGRGHRKGCQVPCSPEGSGALKAARNKLSKANGPLFGQLKKCTDEAQKAEIQAQIDANNAAVKADADKMAELEKEEEELSARIQEIMYSIPQMIDPSVPIGPDDTYNVEAQRFGEPVVPDFPIPYHTEIMESFDGIDMDAAGRVAGNGFYYLLGNIARLHEAVLAYARDFMINKGFTYVIPPFMMHGNVVQGVMSFPEMDAMMYKIEGEDLYLIGTSEHTMIGRFIDQTLDESKMPLTLTSYSPCFRKEKGAHGIEERGIYRIHQFEKQEMIVVCRPRRAPTGTRSCGRCLWSCSAAWRSLCAS